MKRRDCALTVTIAAVALGSWILFGEYFEYQERENWRVKIATAYAAYRRELQEVFIGMDAGVKE